MSLSITHVPNAKKMENDFDSDWFHYMMATIIFAIVVFIYCYRDFCSTSQSKSNGNVHIISVEEDQELDNQSLLQEVV